MRLYLDACALNRLTDPLTHQRIVLEAEAVGILFELISKGEVEWVVSSALRAELQRNPDSLRRDEPLALLRFSESLLTPSAASLDRMSFLMERGFTAFDALHLACAEQGGVDALITTDDRFIKLAVRINSKVRVVNPID